MDRFPPSARPRPGVFAALTLILFPAPDRNLRRPEPRSMSSQERSSRLGLPTTHYFVSISRGDSIRTARLRPAALWTLLALAPLSFAFGLAGAAGLAFRHGLPEAAAFVQAATEAAGKDRRGDGRPCPTRRRTGGARIRTRSRTGSATSRRARRGSSGAARSSPRSPPRRRNTACRPDRRRPCGSRRRPALSRPSLPGNRVSGPRQKRAAAAARARAYAPSGATLAPEGRRTASLDLTRAEPAFIPSLADAALNPDLDAKTRLDLVVRSLDRLDSRAITALAAIDHRALLNSARQSAILGRRRPRSGQARRPEPLANAGGPLIPVDIDPRRLRSSRRRRGSRATCRWPSACMR